MVTRSNAQAIVLLSRLLNYTLWYREMTAFGCQHCGVCKVMIQKMSLRSLLFVLGCIFGLETAFGREVPSAPVQFNRDIRPILASACYRCHGFDAKTREAELRLDVPDEAFATRASGEHAIVPGKLEPLQRVQI